jgi:hypothetical protein
MGVLRETSPGEVPRHCEPIEVGKHRPPAEGFISPVIRRTTDHNGNRTHAEKNQKIVGPKPCGWRLRWQAGQADAKHP